MGCAIRGIQLAVPANLAWFGPVVAEEDFRAVSPIAKDLLRGDQRRVEFDGPSVEDGLVYQTLDAVRIK